MKNYITQALGVGAALTLLFTTACEKDEVKVTIQPSGTPALTAPSNNVVLLQANSAATAATYSWTPVTFGYASSTVTYSLQFDKKGGDFMSPVSFDAGTKLTRTLTVADLNSVYENKGLVKGSGPQAATPVDVRVVASVGTPKDASVASAAASITATPYFFCGQPAADKAWSIIGTVGPGTDWNTDYSMMYDCNSKSYTYTGVLKVGEYKFRYGSAWATNLGGLTKTPSLSGTLKQGGENLSITAAGTYTVTLINPTVAANGDGSGSFMVK